MAIHQFARGVYRVCMLVQLKSYSIKTPHVKPTNRSRIKPHVKLKCRIDHGNQVDVNH